MGRKRTVARVRLAVATTLLAALVAVLLVLAGHAPARASSPPGASSQAAGSEIDLRSVLDDREALPRIDSRATATGQSAALSQQPVADRCARCHLSPTAYHYGLRCGQCHSASRFLPPKAMPPAHPVQLVGRHAAIECSACHKPAKAISSVCSTCHSAPKGHLTGTCSTCHGPQGWADSAAGISGPAAPHLLTTTDDCLVCHAPAGPNWPAPASHKSYKLNQCQLCHRSAANPKVTVQHQAVGLFQGRHTELACVQCHSTGQFVGTTQACTGCHQADDRHDGQFGPDCAQCHTPNGWGGATFDHDQTGFALTGVHGNAACTSCHANGQYNGTPSQCVVCHQADDRHDGQFGSDCAQCHTPNGWSGATFDHGQTGFALTGAHGNAACTRCHANGQYNGTPSQCVACHSEPGYHAGRLGTDCAACHQTGSWFPASYGGLHTFPLGHEGASSCRTCHSDSLAGYSCYGCHNQGKIAEKHTDHDIPDYGNCVACHPNGDDD